VRSRGQGIKVVVLKGAHLAALVYPHLGCRTMADVDLLVPLGQLESARDELGALGYGTGKPREIEIRPGAAKHLDRLSNSFLPSVELHWTLVSATLPLRVTPDQLLQRAVPVSLAGVSTWVLSPEDCLLHQAVHLAAHRFSAHGLRPLCDLAATLRCHRAGFCRAPVAADGP
jgi:hypothetical protein